jgi:hypothetical protein
MQEWVQRKAAIFRHFRGMKARRDGARGQDRLGFEGPPHVGRSDKQTGNAVFMIEFAQE